LLPPSPTDLAELLAFPCALTLTLSQSLRARSRRTRNSCGLWSRCVRRPRCWRGRLHRLLPFADASLPLLLALQLRKLHTELIDYQPPVHLLTLLESIRAISSPPSSSTSAVATTSSLPAWPFTRSPLSNLGIGLSPEEEADRRSLSLLSEKQKTTELVKVLKAHEGLEELDTPKGFLLTGPPGTGKRCVSSSSTGSPS